MRKTKSNDHNQSLFERLGEKYDHKLARTTLLGNIPNGLRGVLAQLYEAKEYRTRRVLCASIINSMFTEQITEFLMSQNLLMALLENDKNLERSTVSSQEYADLYSYLVKKEIIEVLEAPGQMTHGKKAKAGRWKWKEQSILAIFSEYWTEDGIDPDVEYESLLNTHIEINFREVAKETSPEPKAAIEKRVINGIKEWTEEDDRRFDAEMESDPEMKEIFRGLKGR